MYKQSSFVLALLFSACQAVRQAPVSKSLVGFASGMNGDEDLGQDIKMKGEPFHFEQKAAQTEQKDDWNANGEPEKVSILQTPIAKTHTTFYGEKEEQVAAQTVKKDDWNANGEPEKVSILQTPIAKTHTTFHAEKEEQAAAQTEKKDDWNANGEPEKVSILQTPIAKTHTTFYGETEGQDPIRFAEQEKSEDREVRKVDDSTLLQWGEQPGWHGGYPDTIGPYNIDPWVYRYSRENVPPQAYEHYKVYRNPEMSYAHRRMRGFPGGELIGESRVDPEVHGFVSAIFPPLTGSAYEERPYAYNGGLAHPPRYGYASRRSQGFPGGELIGESRVDPEVQGFVSAIFPPLTGSAYEERPYAYNGGLAHPPRSFASRRAASRGFPGGELIGESRVDPEVQGFVSAIFPPLTGSAYEERPYAYNGGLAHPPRAFAEIEKADIGRDEVRPDVYEVVRNNVDPAPLPRMSRPYYFDPYDPSTREKIEYDFTEDSDAGRQHKKREELRLLLEAEEAVAKAKKAKRAQAELERALRQEQEQKRREEIDKLERLRKEKEVRDSLRGIRR